MRTTVDLDETVLAAARSKSRAEGTSLGRALSDLVMIGLTARQPEAAGTGLPVLHGAPGHILTDELVEQLRDDE